MLKRMEKHGIIIKPINFKHQEVENMLKVVVLTLSQFQDFPARLLLQKVYRNLRPRHVQMSGFQEQPWETTKQHGYRIHLPTLHTKTSWNIHHVLPPFQRVP